MSFNIALSGIAAAQKDLNTTANNIANVNTIGFKESRAEFADVYANSIFSNSKTAVGGGATTTQVAQQFHQGSLQFTSNSLDMAISGGGFFVTSSELGSQDQSYTRAGAFKVDSANYMVDSAGNFLQGFPVDEDGNSTSVSLTTTQPIKIPDTAGSPVQTGNVGLQMNLNVGETALDPANFNPADSDTFNNSTSVTIYDSLGESHIMTTYFIKPTNGSFTGESNWVAFYAVDGDPVDVAAGAGTYSTDTNGDGTADATGTASAANPDGLGGVWSGAVLKFNSVGAYTGSDPANITTEALGSGGAGALGPGADGTQTLTIKFNNPTQYASPFEVTELTQDGITVGRLTNVGIGSDGLITASYSNGSTVPLARVALVRFANEQGLTQVGNTSWKASLGSGAALAGEANSGTFGSIRSSALEQSNVDLTTELVDLISAQRNFQANSRTLEVNNTLNQTILQIR
ncbi:flagellar hook protein FlgE [Shewanella sp. SR43-4]|jgi:flagellar hook protein FlgE|uniref:Flagellar hook protein FlgE n=1 Tax=Shewanella vesiculosa TaxID=518738 RepID=A0ABV0FJE3_9GAMM|nr:MULTISPECIES: flagellar hook protein FlgE [Shewanella]NCQ45531.1 flagellar hook protein FlgE [Shewanella frigidimarina]MBB1318178.1 flagellar hook protein FlgE [Shewanella sp. SR43-4]MBB1477747.1 flagellar hook protein FlgE [Shewanella sp. SG41-3]NCO73432.1 flagellar hook protein FlgE [Shewanella vesiculosa]NCP37579.1 flagellar hook protein FlgE [Shewanella vesiculosa]